MSANERGKVRRRNADRVEYANMCKLTALAERVNRGRADPQPGGRLLHGQKLGLATLDGSEGVSFEPRSMQQTCSKIFAIWG